jgi:maltose alpha-D-glucosyltransferase/alpha-amylase
MHYMSEDQSWYKDTIFYEVYVRAFHDSSGDGHGDLAGLTQKLNYLKELGVDCIWLLPIYPSPLKDDGYDIADYYNVLPDYGTLDDFKTLIRAAHDLGLRVITDLVLNHTSDQHPWFQAARADRKSPYRDFYVWSDTDQKYQQARIIFLDTEKSNWTWDEMAGQYYWHRFYSCQPDLNFDNPAVRQEMMEVMKYWLDLGIDGFRADAVPYLFEREGTNCENLPESHAYLKEIRRFMDQNYPGRILLAEANQWPEDVRPYFGDGDEFHMGFHFPVMPRVFMAVAKGDREPLKWILDRTPAIPETCQWCTFLRNHDELTLEMVTEEERQWMWDFYAPEPRMRLNLGIRRRLAPLLENDRRKIELVNSLLFSLPGSPIIYYGDEIGMGDNIWLPDRNGVRTPMQWDDSLNAGFSNVDPDKLYSPIISSNEFSQGQVNVSKQMEKEDSLFQAIKTFVSVRKQYRAFGWGHFKWAEIDDPRILSYWRSYKKDNILIVNNLSGDRNRAEIVIPEEITEIPIDMFTEAEVASDRESSLTLFLEPFEYRWLRF